MEWLGLREGVDFGCMIDLAGLSRVFNQQYGSWTYFGLDHVATCWLGDAHALGEDEAHNGGPHAPPARSPRTVWLTRAAVPVPRAAVGDSVKSLEVFRRYVELFAQPAQLAEAKKTLLSRTPAPSFARKHPSFEGVCMGNRKTCTCGAAFFS